MSAEIIPPPTDRNCSNCACSFLAKHPQEIGRTQLLCRKGPPLLVQQTATDPEGRPVRAVSLTYALTSPELVCFDGWRPIGTLPGELLGGESELGKQAGS
jgi:hypothetical protein